MRSMRLTRVAVAMATPVLLVTLATNAQAQSTRGSQPTLTAAQAALDGLNLVLTPNPSFAGADWIAQGDQAPGDGDPPRSDRTVTVTFQRPPSDS